MDEAIRLLQIEGVTPVGLALAGFFVFVLGLQREWIVTGGRWKAKIEDCDKISAALAACTESNKRCADDYVEARITLARHEEREQMVHRERPRGRGSP